MTALPDRLARAIAVIEEAAILATRFFHARETIGTRSKKAQDFVSEADTTVETLIRERLAKAFPGEAVVGEEMGGTTGDAYWIVDPIDGTSNFLRGSPLWGISLGFVRNGRPELGVVALPALGDILAAADGTGLFVNGQSCPRDVPFAEVSLMSLGDSLSDDIDDIAALHTGLRRSGWIVEGFHATSIGLAFTARGILDGHLQKTTTMWDIAGGAVLAREAGLEVRIGHDPASDAYWIAAGTGALIEATERLWPAISRASEASDVGGKFPTVGAVGQSEASLSTVSDLKIEYASHPVRLKWHRLRRQLSDPLFSLDVMRAGFALGASMELDLRVRADGGFVVLHDENLEGETTGRGRISQKSLDDLRDTNMRDGNRALTFSEDLAAMLQSAHPDALLQFDMKDDYETIGEKGIAHLAAHFQTMNASVIVSGHCLDLIAAIKEKLPHLLRGIDPTDTLVDIYRQEGLKAVEKSLLADIKGPTAPDTVYLQWSLLLQAARDGLDMVSLCRGEGKRVDAWTFTPKSPAVGFSDAEWRDFSTLMALKPDQITTDEATATARAWSNRMTS